MRTAFIDRIRRALADPALGAALDRNAEQRIDAMRRAKASLPDSAVHRQQSRAVRQLSIERLDANLGQFVQRLQQHGVQVHQAADAREACKIVVEIAQRHGAEQVAKSKSMLSEEIRLNQALLAAGIQPVETDLGELIVQLRGEAPSHMVTPALHLSRETISETFVQQLGAPASTEIPIITAAARGALRKVFLAAKVGVSGVNFGVAETGTLCLVTNEGNGRMVTTLPPVHIALMGIERLVRSMDDLRLMLEALPRSATGQKLTSYVSLLNGPKRDADPDGAQERHVVLVDNGRTRLRYSSVGEALLCIRCGACLNACPVFREIGGHAYGSVYPGPIGAIVSPAQFGMREFGHLAEASTLCGACTESCPVGIDFPLLLQRMRAANTSTFGAPVWAERGIRFYTWLAASKSRFRWAQRTLAIATRLLPATSGWLATLPEPLARWTGGRDFPRFAFKPFRARVAGLQLQGSPRRPELELQEETAPLPEVPGGADKVTRFGEELELVGGEFIRCTQAEVADRVVGQLHMLGVGRLMAWGPVEPTMYQVLRRLDDNGFEVIHPRLPTNPADRPDVLAELNPIQVGLTGALAGIAETGTLALSTGRRHSLLPSLLPRVHLAVLRARDIFDTMSDWMAAGGAQVMASTQNLVLITGPSRTADIELTLTLGVHGPAQLIVFCLE